MFGSKFGPKHTFQLFYFQNAFISYIIVMSIQSILFFRQRKLPAAFVKLQSVATHACSKFYNFSSQSRQVADNSSSLRDLSPPQEFSGYTLPTEEMRITAQFDGKFRMRIFS